MYEHAQRHANDHGNDHVHARPNDHSDEERGDRTDKHAGQIISNCENHRRLLISSISDALSCEFLCAEVLFDRPIGGAADCLWRPGGATTMRIIDFDLAPTAEKSCAALLSQSLPMRV